MNTLLFPSVPLKTVTCFCSIPQYTARIHAIFPSTRHTLLSLPLSTVTYFCSIPQYTGCIHAIFPCTWHTLVSLSTAEHGTYFYSVPLLSLVLSKSVVNGYGQGDRGSNPANFLLDALCWGVKWPRHKPNRRTTSRKEIRHSWSYATAPLYFFT